MRGQGRSPCPPLFPQQVNEEEEGVQGRSPCRARVSRLCLFPQ